VFGGYSKEKNTAKKSEGKIHTDMWMLNLRGILPTAGGGAVSLSRLDLTKAAWQKVRHNPASPPPPLPLSHLSGLAQISNKGSPPSPRCGASMITYKNKGIFFGGVFDDEGPRHTLQSSFYNDLYAFDFERKRWYELGVKHATDLSSGKKKRRKQKDKTAEDEEESSEEDEEEEDDEDEGKGPDHAMLLQQQQENLFGYIDDSGNIVYVNLDDEDPEDQPPLADTLVTAPVDDDWINVTSTPASAAPSDHPDLSALSLSSTLADADAPPPPPAVDTAPKIQLTQSDMLRTAFLEEESREASQQQQAPASHANPLVQFFNNFTTSPVGRINCQLVTKGCSLYVYGGVTEFGDVEITLDDCWSLDLNKRDKWRPVLRGNMTDLVWKGNDGDDQSERTGEGDSDEDDDDEESGDDSDEEDEEEGDEADSANKKKKKSGKREERERTGDRDREAAVDTEKEGEDQDNKKRKQKAKSSRAGIRGEMEDLRSQLPGGGEDMNRIPLTGAAATAAAPSHKSAAANKKTQAGAANELEIESLRDFYRFTLSLVLSSLWLTRLTVARAPTGKPTLSRCGKREPSTSTVF
jgi:hypothetical protein